MRSGVMLDVMGGRCRRSKMVLRAREVLVQPAVSAGWFYTAECCRSAEWPPLISAVVVAAKIVKKVGD
jgi:hypothetical protein